jgi:hypothetical protein
MHFYHLENKEHIHFFQTWVGISRVVNHFRQHTLKLEPLEDDQALSMMQNVPHTYCWSPSLVAKPDDWGSHIDVCGFFFLSRSSSYQPPQALHDFLANGSSPLYIGFGSIIGHNQPHIFKIVRDALKETGRRAVVCNKLATANDTVPEYMFPIDDCPHDWLFQQGVYDLSSVSLMSAHEILERSRCRKLRRKISSPAKILVKNYYQTVSDFNSGAIISVHI